MMMIMVMTTMRQFPGSPADGKADVAAGLGAGAMDL